MSALPSDVGAARTRRTVVVMAKAPIPGFAKTRLARETGLAPDEVARIAEALLRDTLAACARADARLVVCFAPRESRALFERLAPDAVLEPQVEGDLGARMRAAFGAAFAGGAERVVMLGTDAPHVAREAIAAAFAALEGADVVLGPAEDGGYYAIGARRAVDGLFEGVAWSTDRVLAQTLALAGASGISCALLAPDFDVDGAADLDRLARLLEASPERAPGTARVLAARSRPTARGADEDDAGPPGPIERALADDHRRLDALLARAIDADPFDAAAFGAFRAELLRHIAVEERIVMAEAQRRDPSLAEPALALRVEHGAMAILLVPTPDRALALELRGLIAAHMAIEEGPGGVHARCERALRAEADELAARMRAYPPVRVAAYLDVPGRPRTARAALEAMERRGGLRRSRGGPARAGPDQAPPAGQ